MPRQIGSRVLRAVSAVMWRLRSEGDARGVLKVEYDLAVAAYHLNYGRDPGRQARYVFGAPRCRFLER